MEYQVLLFYKYVPIDNPLELKDRYRALCEKYSLRGRTIIAHEGINSTVEGTIENTEAFLKEFLTDERFSHMQIKRSRGDGNSFPKLSVKVRLEIVGTHFPKEIDPTKETGKYLKPEELREWYEKEEDFVVIDMRNSYEFASGRFKNSIDPGMQASRELPEKMDKLRIHKDKKVLTVCTGGVRCEKMSAYLLHEGFKDVYQLDGGMHSYMEKYPGKDFLGTLFTFDDRLVMDFGGDREIVGECKHCSAKTEKYQNCSNASCNMLFLVCPKCVESDNIGFCSNTCKETATSFQTRIRA
jgi:UPF0176 protein